ncbi:MAG: GGDEF domain-containing protein [Lachnospiraceae bacterium]|nr:GGDEF domain-containing protein [Lachnospiraceae bacterium]
MRKRIGLIIGEADCEYEREFIPYVFKAAKRYDYDVFVFGNYGTFDRNLRLYSDGEETVFRIPDYGTFEGFIVEESQFNITGMEKNLYKYLSKNVPDEVPVIYLKTVKDRFYSVLASDKQAVKAVTEHFIRDHHFTRICHMAGRRELTDAIDRMEGYLEAMEEAGLKVTSDMIFWGDYWYNKAGEALDTFLHGTEEYPEAIICANDYMAIAMVKELQRRGIRVPEDVCVSGYDNAEDGTILNPPLTTVEVPMNEMADLAVNMIHNLRAGREVNRIEYTSNLTKLHLRDSCGCVHFDEKQNLSRKLEYLRYQAYGMDMCVSLEAGYHIAFEEEGIYETADSYFGYNRAESGYLCLCTDAFAANRRPLDIISEYTDDMVLKRVFHRGDEKNYESPETVFPRSAILPSGYLDTPEPSLYFIYPIHSLNLVYGYMILHYDEGDWVNKFTQDYLQSFGEAIENFTIRNEFMDMVEIRKMYLVDELTELSNRRGYEQHLQTLIDRAKRRKLHLTLVSIDMDGLKFINDHYGHFEGDYALKAVAEAIRKSITEEEVAARIGGDEYAVILISEDPRRYLAFESDFADAVKAADENSGKPYEIHASFGLCPFENLDAGAQEYMEKADERMYQNKMRFRETPPEYVRS